MFVFGALNAYFANYMMDHRTINVSERVPFLVDCMGESVKLLENSSSSYDYLLCL
jgi:hypothetical protein